MVDKIIFLDIDGPMIPGTMYLEDPFCSMHQTFDPRSVMILKKIIEKAGDVKIVFNTAHNNTLEKTRHSPGLLNVWHEHGFDDYLHKDCKTTYPNPMKDYLVPDDKEITRRLVAIYEWLNDHYDITQPNQVLWIAFDDEPIDHKRACTVDFDTGLSVKEFNHAAKYLNFQHLHCF